MKREEKNMLSRQKIIENATKEFSQQGYGLSSVNTICSTGKISKGILYHYFKDKDQIYLTCIKECFDNLTNYLKENTSLDTNNVKECFQTYFDVRYMFFKQNPLYQRLFSEAVISPPPHLQNDIKEIKKEFDTFNVHLLDELLDQVKLRSDITRNEVIETFRQYQDFINAKYQMIGSNDINIESREKSCNRALTILLYGVITRGDE